MSIRILYRKRLIPQECIPLKDDIILKQTEDLIVTKWRTLHPKRAFSQGASCYYLKKGIKVSRFCKEDGSLYCWYCDIVAYEQNGNHELTITDLLADVVIFPDGSIRVMDLDELAKALDMKLITAETLSSILVCLNDLLTMIYSGRFQELQSELNTLI
ncbi:MAG TPA: DUF402 domain-containing protein [Lachnospiraceae bacterium]|nr:DUF402 domain-containing protein [Lachnospiraceae bacterium]